jgi:heme/copper-type cytochrome/quinol oxidase subunit 2
MRKNNLVLTLVMLIGLAIFPHKVQAYADVAPEPVVLGAFALVVIGIFILVACLIAFIIIKLSRKKNDINKPN